MNPKILDPIWILGARKTRPEAKSGSGWPMEGRKAIGGGQVLIWVAILVVVLAILAAPVASIDDKCAACNAVAAEIEIGLAKEKPRNHLDMRHRLDSRGQREGKVIDYKTSELRVVELLDGLCEKMQDYTLKTFESAKQEWIKVKDWDTLAADKQEARAYSKDISSFCGRLMEETEDDLTEWIKRGSVHIGGVSRALCQELTKHCSMTSGSSYIDAGEL